LRASFCFCIFFFVYAAIEIFSTNKVEYISLKTRALRRRQYFGGGAPGDFDRRRRRADRFFFGGGGVSKISTAAA